MELTIAVTHEPPGYVARCIEFDVASQGDTTDEALANVREALELFFEDAEFPEHLERPLITSIQIAA
jgi:predicted RNase H-like HicB family nuclease